MPDVSVVAKPIDVDVDVAEVGRLSFGDFYQAHAGPVGRALALSLADDELAEDALNEAMVRALARWKQVQAMANPAGWVYRVGLNWARSWLRRRRRERDRPFHARPASFGADDVADPRVGEALAALSVDHRAVVVCRIHLDWSTAQTSDALGIAEGTVKSRLARALGQLRAELGTEPDAPASDEGAGDDD